MKSRDIVRAAIAFDRPPRLPFWQHEYAHIPDDVCDVWEMDRAQAGWFFDTPGLDDWGCLWAQTEVTNMGQVVRHPLADWSSLPSYHPPNPTNSWYFERIEPVLRQAKDRYVVVTSHFALLERFHMLRGFAAAMEDFYLEPQNTARVLDMVLEFHVRRFEELHRRFGNAVHGVFLTDDWGTQERTFVGPKVFDAFFAERYRRLFGAVHRLGWHVFLHSCGRINAFVPKLIEAGADVLNMQQPRCYGLVEFGESFKGKVCFLTTADIQATLPRGDEAEIREEVRLFKKHWATPEGGLIVFNYGDPAALAIGSGVSWAMFEEFLRS